MKMGAGNLKAFKEYGLWEGLLKNYVILIWIFLFAMNVIFYEVIDRAPRVHPWVNEPDGGIMGIWRHYFQGMGLIV